MSDLNNALNFQVVFSTSHFLLTNWKNCQDHLISMSHDGIENWHSHIYQAHIQHLFYSNQLLTLPF